MEESNPKEKRLCTELDEWIANNYRARGREDLISKLPESLISQMILSHLPTKDVVKTSVLSDRWKTLWLLTPSLELDANEFSDYNEFVSFVNRFLDFSKEACFHKLRLSIRRDENDQSCVSQWVDSVVKRKPSHIDVECILKRKCIRDEVMPLSLYVCKTLVYLRLNRVTMGDFESVSLPRLKILRLEYNVFANGAALELLISSSPVLEDLSIVRSVDDNLKVLRVSSQTLTSFSTEYYYFEVGNEMEADADLLDTKDSGVYIDAPRLEFLNFEDGLSEIKVIRNSGSLAKVNVIGAFDLEECFDVAELPRQNMIRNFFASISGVREMMIASHTSEYLYYNTQIEPLPQFCNLHCFEAELSLHYLEMLPRLLESFPNLKSLVLAVAWEPRNKDEQLTFSSVPRCLVSSLEFVEIKSSFHGYPSEMEAARYFVENSGVLKKLVLHMSCSMLERGCRVFMDLLAFPKRSSTCRIIFC